MRKLIVSEAVTLDGYFAGPNGEIDWQVLGPAHRSYSIELLDEADTLLFGRVTYEMMAAFWPERLGGAYDPQIAERMNGRRKIVVSRTLNKPEWNGSELLGDELGEGIRRLKSEPGGTIAVMGSGSVVTQLTALGLIDEYRLIVTPVVLGGGRPLFDGEGLTGRVPLRLLDAVTLEGGNIVVRYAGA